MESIKCGCSSMVEPQPSKLKTRVRSPSPACYIRISIAALFALNDCRRKVAEDAAAPAALAAVAQLVERVLGKDEVTGPNPVSSS